MLKDCDSSFKNLAKLDSYIQKVNYNDIMRRIRRSIGSFFHLVMNSLEGFAKGDYVEAGKGLGDLLKFLLYSSSQQGILGEFLSKLLD